MLLAGYTVLEPAGHAGQIAAGCCEIGAQVVKVELVGPDIPVSEAFRGIVPFVLADGSVLTLIILRPVDRVDRVVVATRNGITRSPTPQCVLWAGRKHT